PRSAATLSRYFDVIALPRQRVDFQMPLAGSRLVNVKRCSTSAIDVSLQPTLMADGRIAVQIWARSDSGSQTTGTVTIVDNAFTSLVRMRADGHWINIDAMGQLASNI
ncbi:MAG: hypothetical protein ACE5NM_13000, partial [Sedimentisphaerales bacterium]